MPFTGSSASSLSGDPFAAPLGDEYDPIALSQLARDADDALRTSTSVDDPDADSFQSTRRRDAVRALRRLAVDAEGPGAPFTKTPRGMQLLRLISVVVRNVGLSDKVGALRALQILKANDEALRRLGAAGSIPALLRALRTVGNERVEDRATRADAARALSAMSSSADVCKMMIRGGALETLGRVCADAAASASEVVSDEAIYAADALTRMSGRASVYDSRALFPISSEPSHADLVAESTVRSVVELLTSEMTVVHRDASEALATLASSGPCGRRAVARCGSVLPLVTSALGGDRQRDAALAALRTVARAPGDSPPPRVSSMKTLKPSRDSSPSGSGQDREELTMAEKTRPPVVGTASRMGGVNFFHEMIDLLCKLLELRHSLEPAAADAALALWALAWQPSNREHMVNHVTSRLTRLASEGCSTSRDDALSVLSVLALDDDGREAIRKQHGGDKLLDYLAESSMQVNSPRGVSGSNGMTFDELIDRRERRNSGDSSRLSYAVSRLHC